MSGNYDVDLSGAWWRKSSHSSATKDCVEVAYLAGERTAVRDSKNPTGPALVFTAQAWTAFTTTITAG